jgi:hypothetical protein
VTVTKLPPESLQKYVGTYEYAPGSGATITSENDLLFLQQGANPLKLPLVANSETLFVSRTEGDTLEFMRDDQGAITGFIYHRGGSPDRKAIRKR